MKETKLSIDSGSILLLMLFSFFLFFFFFFSFSFLVFSFCFVCLFVCYLFLTLYILGAQRLFVLDWYEYFWVVLACESLHVCTVCIQRCEHARFCVEVFMWHIFIYFLFIYLFSHSFSHSSRVHSLFSTSSQMFLRLFFLFSFYPLPRLSLYQQ